MDDDFLLMSWITNQKGNKEEQLTFVAIMRKEKKSLSRHAQMIT